MSALACLCLFVSALACLCLLWPVCVCFDLFVSVLACLCLFMFVSVLACLCKLGPVCVCFGLFVCVCFGLFVCVCLTCLSVSVQIALSLVIKLLCLHPVQQDGYIIRAIAHAVSTAVDENKIIEGITQGKTCLPAVATLVLVFLCPPGQRIL